MKKVVVKIGVVLIAGFLLIMNACEYETIVPEVSDLPDSVMFSTDIVPIFEAKCNNAGCHNAIPPVLTPDVAYLNIMLSQYVDTTITPDQTDFLRKLSDGGSMEKYILPQEYNLILKWIEQNAPDN